MVKRLEKLDHQKMADGNEQQIKKKAGSPGVSTTNGGLATIETTEILASRKQRLLELRERKNLVLWKHPILTLECCFGELMIFLNQFVSKLWQYIRWLILLGLIISIFIGSYNIEGRHQFYISIIKTHFARLGTWLFLGVLSSIGLGTGLHTFILYLGPHIAAVTLAATECGSLDFPQPPYPDEIICPEGVPQAFVSILSIMAKVRLEAFMWGIGTAIGELPPFFVARTYRLTGQDPEDDDLREALRKQDNPTDDKSYVDASKHWVQWIVKKAGFFGILVCASIPNPLFDLAGITCGHFLVPFWTFFGATLIGKAVIKMHIQKLFVILAFDEKHIDQVLTLMGRIPYFGKRLQAPFLQFVKGMKAKLHRKVGTPVSQETNWISFAFEKLVLIMVIFFIISIINSMAQNYHKRLSKAKKSQ